MADSHPIALGESLAALIRTIPLPHNAAAAPPPPQPPRLPSLVALKYNFKPESVADSSRGVLHSPHSTTNTAAAAAAEWHLELDASPTTANPRPAHVFNGTQHTAKPLDCVLVWDHHRRTYVLDRIASTLSLKFSRSKNTLSDAAAHALAQDPATSAASSSRKHRKRIPELDNHDPRAAAAGPSTSSSSTAAVQRASSRLSMATRLDHSASSSSRATSPASSSRRARPSAASQPAPPRLRTSTSGPGRRIAADVEEFDQPAASSAANAARPAASREQANKVEASRTATTQPRRSSSRPSPPPRQRSDSLRSAIAEPAPKRSRGDSTASVRSDRHNMRLQDSAAARNEGKWSDQPDRRSNDKAGSSQPKNHTLDDIEVARSSPPAPPPPRPMAAVADAQEEGEASEEDDLAQALELDLERELDKLSDNGDDAAPSPAAAGTTQPRSPSPSPRSEAIAPQRPAPPSGDSVVASPVPARFRLKRMPTPRGTSVDSLGRTNDSPGLPTTPAVHTPTDEHGLSPDVGGVSGSRPAAVSISAPTLVSPPSLDGGSPMGLGLRTIETALTPVTSPQVDPTAASAARDRVAPQPPTTAAVAAAIETDPETTTAPAVSWKPRPPSNRDGVTIPRPAYDDDDDSADDEEDDEEKEEEDDDEDDDGLDDFAAELDLTLSAGGEGGSDAVSYGGEVAMRSSSAGGGGAAGGGSRGGGGGGGHRGGRGGREGGEGAARRKIYGLGGRREEEDDLEDSD